MIYNYIQITFDKRREVLMIINKIQRKNNNTSLKKVRVILRQSFF